MDLQIIQDQIDGLTARLKTLRSDKDLFVKAQGLEEEAEKARKEITDLEPQLQTIKEEISELRGKKTEALSTTGEALSAKMAEALPEGKGLLEISDDGVFIGWDLKGVRRPYAGLSAGQKATFNSALSHALLGPGPKLLIIEGGELDQDNLISTMEKLAGLPEDTQVILNSWHRPFGRPEGWLGWKETEIQ